MTTIADMVESQFGAAAAEATALLSRYGADAAHREVERVRRAVLTLSAGDLVKLRHNVQLACTDYRDVLMFAEQPPADDEPASYEEAQDRRRRGEPSG